MILFSCKEMQMAFGDDIILDGVDLSVNEGDRIGIIGANGAGKTTLIRIFTGEYLPTSGNCYIHSSVRSSVSYLRQDSGLDSELSVYDEFMKPYANLKELENQIAETEERLVRFGDGEAIGHVLSGKLSDLYEKYKNAGGLTYESRVRSILKGLGFDETDFTRNVSTLSGGQKTRLALAKILLSDAKILILDEPTNHLDEQSCEWLEGELNDFRGTLLVISHDRAFLDKVTKKTLLIERTGVYLYNAPYSAYTQLRKADTEYRQKCYVQQQKEIERINAFIENQRKWNRERNIIAVNSRLKYLDRMELIEKPTSPEDPPAISFDIDVPGGNDVLAVTSLGFSYPGNALFRNVDLEVHKGERVFITGPNGSGKTTFLRVIAGRLSDEEKQYVTGSFRIGRNTAFSYYAQDLSDVSGEGTVFDALYDKVNYPGKPAALIVPPVKIRNSLASMGFRGNDVFKDLKELSGGERSRLQLLMISYERRPLLILDEPTNHLDVASREVLEEALLKFEGTLIAVSHDRYFREKLATSTLDISSFADPGEQADKAAGQKNGSGKEDYLRQKELRSRSSKLKNELKRLETDIAKKEARSAEIDAAISDPAIASDHVKLGALYEEKNTLDEEMLEILSRIDAARIDLDRLENGQHCV
ncbi:MAG: ABC-F family ATP-binding cassette domain-containing protein [Clostridia bacterium]|nr:ABC-F family ATP-binding cassette domain-containing protein [Clostridia bacterium]